MKKVLVTGSSRGIGRAIALGLARAGYDPVLHCVSRIDAAEEVAKAVKALGCTGEILRFDISNRDESKAALDAWVAANGAPYGVVLNAGIVDDNAFPALEDEQWDRVLRTDLDGFYNVLKPLVLPMVQARAGGRIVVLSSMSGVAGNRGQTNYAAAKAGVIGAAKSLAVELARRKITVNCVAPGPTQTGWIDDDLEKTVVPLIPMGKLIRPEDIAETILFLAGEQAGMLTGQVIKVSGGHAI